MPRTPEDDAFPEPEGIVEPDPPRFAWDVLGQGAAPSAPPPPPVPVPPTARPAPKFHPDPTVRYAGVGGNGLTSMDLFRTIAYELAGARGTEPEGLVSGGALGAVGMVGALLALIVLLALIPSGLVVGLAITGVFLACFVSMTLLGFRRFRRQGPQ